MRSSDAAQTSICLTRDNIPLEVKLYELWDFV
jgi:hypothetical protein